MRTRSVNRLFDPISILPLVFFRVAFGGLMLWEVWRYFHYDRIARYYIEPTFYFHYYGFAWVRPLPAEGMVLLFHALGLLSVMVLLGANYRTAISAFWLCFSYVFLLDQAQYLNHFYLISLISFLMIFVPAHRALSVDALLRPHIRTRTAPAWALWALRGQMALVYVFGGLAKINPDWLAGEPMRAWLADRTDFPVIGAHFTAEWMVMLFSYGGLLFDLLVVPLLLWRRTRLLALILATGFHLTNARLFNIGVFPWLALAATLLFLPPGWFRVPGRAAHQPSAAPHQPPYTARRRWIMAALAGYFAIQIVLPLRHWLYPGDASWTEEGHTLAWHMRLRQKRGVITFVASNPHTGATWPLYPEDMLTARQFDQMKDNPHMILRLVHHLARALEREGYSDIEIRVWAMISLNSRAPQLLIDPTSDLVHQPDTLLAADWILPLVQQPFPHETPPALLVSRRYRGVLALVNVTESPYPLSALRIQAGNTVLSGADFGIASLPPGGCVLSHTPDADLSAVLLPCNLTGTRVEIAPVLLRSPLLIQTAAEALSCGGLVCVAADSPSPSD